MISQTGIHALRAVAYLADISGDDYVGATKVAERIGAPPNYLGKILQALAENDLLESRRGYDGGFRLSRKADEISLSDVLEHIERLDELQGCLLGSEKCSDNTPCRAHSTWTEVRDTYLRFLAETSIRDLISS